MLSLHASVELRSLTRVGLILTVCCVHFSCYNPMFADREPVRPPSTGKERDPTKTPRSPNGDSCLRLVGGMVTDKEPQTALLIGAPQDGRHTICTGTWVGENTLVTASHCLVDTENGGIRYVPGSGNVTPLTDLEIFYASGISPTKVFIGAPEFTIGRFDQNEFAKGMNRDLAVLVFPPKTAPAYVPILEREANLDERVTLVGYGVTHSPGVNASGSKEELDVRRRFGNNKLVKQPDPATSASTELQKLLPKTLYSVAGPAISDGLSDNGRAIFGVGDSGGPMLVGSALVGVATAGALIPGFARSYFDGATGLGYYVPLHSIFAKTVLQTAESEGAVIHRVASPAEAKIVLTNSRPPNEENPTPTDQPADTPKDGDEPSDSSNSCDDSSDDNDNKDDGETR